MKHKAKTPKTVKQSTIIRLFGIQLAIVSFFGIMEWRVPLGYTNYYFFEQLIVEYTFKQDLWTWQNEFGTLLWYIFGGRDVLLGLSLCFGLLMNAFFLLSGFCLCTGKLGKVKLIIYRIACILGVLSMITGAIRHTIYYIESQEFVLHSALASLVFSIYNIYIFIVPLIFRAMTQKPTGPETSTKEKPHVQD